MSKELSVCFIRCYQRSRREGALIFPLRLEISIGVIGFIFIACFCENKSNRVIVILKSSYPITDYLKLVV